MKKLISIFSISILSVFAFAMPVMAFELASGDNVIVSETILDDMYILAGGATIEADILGDLHVMGGSVVVNGNVSEDLIVAGGRVSIFGNVEGDLRVLGGQVSIYGNVGDDVVMLGGLAEIGKDSVISGSILTGSGSLAIEGTVKENLRGAVGMLILRGAIEGNVTITIEDSITIYETAKIFGDLNYSAIIETEFPEGTVEGLVKFNKFEDEAGIQNITLAYFGYKFLSFCGALILVLAFVFLMPQGLMSSSKLTKDNILKAFGMGVLTMIIAFISPIILMMTIVGIPIALIISALLLIVVYVSKIFVAAWLSGYIVKFDKKKKSYLRTKLFFAMALAMLIYYLLGIIPFVGWLINAVLFLIGVGGIVLVKNEYYQFLKSKKMV